MASWREIDRVRKDANGARELATRLLKIYPGELTKWEEAFLESISSYTELFEFTTRQSEKLLQVRDDLELVAEYRGFSIPLLIKNVFDARLDLSEADEQWFLQIREKTQVSIRRKHLGRLMRCARELNIIEEEMST
ncbi:MAG: hypothetical protein QOF14_2007 [Hyphomicrobiales bacterium]|jgi:hypothetical protein|nr:hypothetical protein [Hyphomicrobiales bacterium]